MEKFPDVIRNVLAPRSVLNQESGQRTYLFHIVYFTDMSKNPICLGKTVVSDEDLRLPSSLVILEISRAPSIASQNLSKIWRLLFVADLFSLNQSILKPIYLRISVLVSLFHNFHAAFIKYFHMWWSQIKKDMITICLHNRPLYHNHADLQLRSFSYLKFRQSKASQ